MAKLHLNTEWNRTPVLQRYVVDAQNGCWIWQGYKLKTGYGQVQVNGARFMAHRYFYEQHIGSIPDGAFVCHHCDNPSCVNPAHLWVGTCADNVQDMISKGRDKRSSVISAEQAAQIRTDNRKTAEIAQDYGISPSNVSFIQTGKTWRALSVQPRPNRKTGPRSNISEAMVREIRASCETQRAIAKRLGISQQHISLIRRGLSWGHVK